MKMKLERRGSWRDVRRGREEKAKRKQTTNGLQRQAWLRKFSEIFQDLNPEATTTAAVLTAL